MKRHLLPALLVFLFLEGPAVPADAAGESPTDYGPAVKALEDFLRKEMARWDIPCLSVALVDDQQIVWQAGFGLQDPGRKIPATENTVYRVGSISKLFTALAVMKLDERKLLDIDAPITRHVPDLVFKNPFPGSESITLRHLISHHAGIIRESPVGSYFDDSEPGIEKTVKSIAGTELVYPAGKRTKYSNVGPTVAGYIIEKVTGTPFAEHMEQEILGPLGMSSSSFLPDKEAIRKNLARAYMVDFEGRYFPAPTFSLGTLPAGNLYSTVGDLSKLMMMLFAGGRAGQRKILEEKTLGRMLQVQFASKDSCTGFGLGFFLGRMWNRRTVSHCGAVYGFASAFFALPEEKLGVVVLNDVDCANGFNDKVVQTAFRLLLNAKVSAAIPPLPEVLQIGAAEIEEYAGKYTSRDREAWASVKDGSLELGFLGTPHRLAPVAKDGFIADGRLGYGDRFDFFRDEGGRVAGFRTGSAEYRRVPGSAPNAGKPERFRDLAGDYGWPHNILRVFVKDGHLACRVEWFFEYPLREVGGLDFAFPDYGLYEGEKIEFVRGASGRIVEARMGAVSFRKR
jgi:CubicO group peptidase (beta-lactamase class C family)